MYTRPSLWNIFTCQLSDRLSWQLIIYCFTKPLYSLYWHRWYQFGDCFNFSRAHMVIGHHGLQVAPWNRFGILSFVFFVQFDSLLTYRCSSNFRFMSWSADVCSISSPVPNTMILSVTHAIPFKPPRARWRRFWNISEFTHVPKWILIHQYRSKPAWNVVR